MAQELSLHLSFRFVGTPAHVQGFNEIPLKLWTYPTSQKEVPAVPIGWKSSAGDFVVGLQILLQCRNSTDTEWSAQLLRSTGTLEDAKLDKKSAPFTLFSASNSNSSFFIAIENAKGSGEFWSDVSLLHSTQAPGTNPLDLG